MPTRQENEAGGVTTGRLEREKEEKKQKTIKRKKCCRGPKWKDCECK